MLVPSRCCGEIPDLSTLDRFVSPRSVRGDVEPTDDTSQLNLSLSGFKVPLSLALTRT